MFTSGEKRGLLALIILLLLLVTFVICRRALFSPSPNVEAFSIKSGSDAIVNDTLSASIEAFEMLPVNPSDSAARNGAVKKKKKSKKERAPKRNPVVRDPLSEPVNP